MSKLRELLEGLGDTPEKIHDTLKEKGCTGEPRDPDCCVVADFLFRSGYKYAGVFYESAGCEITADRESVPASDFPPLREFLRRFDAYEYEDLLTPEP